MTPRGRNRLLNGTVYCVLVLLISMAFARTFGPSSSGTTGTGRPTPLTGGDSFDPSDYRRHGWPYSGWTGRPEDSGMRRLPLVLLGNEGPCRTPSHFSGIEELLASLGPPSGGYYWGGSVLLSGGSSSSGSMTSYSGTNNQVKGVDEPDIEKTDGRFLYWAGSKSVDIVQAFPPETAGVVSRISIPGRVNGLLVNGDHLAVLWTSWVRVAGSRYLYEPLTYLHVYDVSDPAYPTLWENVTVRGSYLDARMIDDYAYVIVRSSPYDSNGTLSLPWIEQDGNRMNLTFGDIAHFDDSGGSRQLAIVLAVNVRAYVPIDHEVFLASDASQVYVSTRSLYVAAAASWSSGWDWRTGIEKSAIHKLAISDGFICYVASGVVNGTILNQFSMDEYNGYFRVATTTGTWGGSSQNHLYVLNATLAQVGKIEDLASGERVYSARFLGERAYLVTFKKVDPFFVIDLSSPMAPKVLGYLKIPGYSSYLHPYDATHVIGLGKDTVDMGTFAWYQGVKLSLFDVSDVEHPQEVSHLVIGDRGTESEALITHKAFLFIPSQNLLVIPIDLRVIDRSGSPNPPPSTYGTLVWQGAYAISVTLDAGFEVAARIAHNEDASSCGNYCPTYTVRRSLYIEHVLYTVSAASVKMNDLATFDKIGTVSL